MDLLDGWVRACHARGATGDVAPVGARLLAAYGAPERVYHDVRHLQEVLTGIDELAAAAADPDLVRLAGWFHDAVYTVDAEAGHDTAEEASAALAERDLAAIAVPAGDRQEVARLVRLTATHAPQDGDSNGAVLCDADLAVLARDADGYAAYAAGVRREYAAVPEPAFRAGRAAILRALMAAPTLFRTEPAQQRWEARARANVAAELAALDG